MTNETTVKKSGKAGKIITWIITGILAAAILIVLFFNFVPGFGMYVVRSDSMSPGIRIGDVIFTRPAKSVQAGQIITFEKEGRIVTHRVVSLDNGKISTKGDANKTADTGTITIENVQGAYCFKVPAVGRITNR